MYRGYYQGCTVLVTGGASGIGLTTCQQFLESGATVICVDYDKQALDDAVKKVSSNQFIGRTCDLTDVSQIISLTESLQKDHDKLDVLVNNAGRGTYVPIDKMTIEDYNWHFDILLKAPMFLVKHAIPLLKCSDHPCVINIASVCATIEWPNHSLYSSAKSALVKYTRHLAGDCPWIRSNCIMPGFIDTPIMEKGGLRSDLKMKVFANLSKYIPMNRIGKPEDIANLILFLCSDQASYITGANIPVDGGYSLVPDWHLSMK